MPVRGPWDEEDEDRTPYNVSGEALPPRPDVVRGADVGEEEVARGVGAAGHGIASRPERDAAAGPTGPPRRVPVDKLDGPRIRISHPYGDGSFLKDCSDDAGSPAAGLGPMTT